MKSVAETKKSQNIAEYIVYMYQMEDLIRSYQGNISEIDEYVVSKYPVDADEKKAISDWFADLTTQMKEEQILEKGHLKKTQIYVDALAKLHWELLKTDKIYFETYQNAKPHVIQAVLDAAGENLGNEIQICLNGVYGLLLCRLLGQKVSDEQLKSAEAFGEVLSLLSLSFHDQELSKN